MKCNKCNVNEVPIHRKTKCDVCAKVKEDAWNAKSNPPVPVDKPVEVGRAVAKSPEVEKAFLNGIKAPTGEYQSLVYNKTLDDNIYEWGIMPKAGCPFWKHKVKYETIKQLNELIEDRKDIKFEDIPPSELPKF